MDRRRKTLGAVLAVGLAVGLAQYTAPGAAAVPAGPPATSTRPAPADLPPDWALTVTDSGPRLTWRSPERVAMGDAAVGFYAGDRLLGTPEASADRRTFHLDLTGHREITGTVPADLADLQVRAAGRRLDAAGRAAAQRAADENAAAPPAAAAALPTAKVDPGVRGRYRTVTGEYVLPAVRLPGLPAAVEQQAVVVAPRGAPGRRPLALFLHGRHYTCFAGPSPDNLGGGWPCAAGSRPVPSHRGYLAAQRLLASQGYVTVSISANGINGQDGRLDDGGAQARSSLVRLHLARWAGWARSRRAAPAIVRVAPPADLSKVLLVGHSRGGEGVNRAAIDSLSPPPADRDGYRGRVRWRIRGTVLIGPTIFGHNPAADVPSVVFLPGCDGDVSDLQGQLYVDGTRRVSRDTALHSALYLVGANHNFFNTEWTPGQAKAPADDDFRSEGTDRICTPGGGRPRLTATQQQKAGATYIAAAARLFVRGDDRVRPLLDGSGVRARSAGRARVLSHAIGAARKPLLLPAPGVKVSGAAGTRLCTAVHPNPAVGCLPATTVGGGSPHFVPFGYLSPEPGRYAVAMAWSRPGQTIRLKPARAASVSGARSLALRLIVPPNRAGSTRLDVAVVDSRGRRAVLGRVSLTGVPGTANTTSHWAQEVRVPISAAVRARLDLRRLVRLDLIPRSASGRAWLVDAWGWRAGTPAVRPVALPRVDIGELTVKEGDSGVRTYRVPVRVSGRGTGTFRLFQTDSQTERTTSRLVTVRPGTRHVDVPIAVRGNPRYGYDAFHLVSAKAVRGTVIGDYDGGLLVANDDPMPQLTITPVADRVTEGAALTWRVTIPAPADAHLWAYLPVVAPGSGTELSSTDVDATWLEHHFGAEPLPARPLSSLDGGLWAELAPGQLQAELTVPTLADGVTESEEVLRAKLWLDGDEDGPTGPEVTGTVLDGS